MKHILAVALLTFTAFAFVGCVDDVVVESEATSVFDESDITDAKLAMSISNFTVNAESATRVETPTDEEEIMSDFEKKVDNIWVFQYDTDGNLLIKPRYYTAEASETDGNWDVLLKPNVTSTIYVVTNVNSKSWAEEYSDFLTIDQLKASTLPEPASIYDLSDDAVEGHIPAQGSIEVEAGAVTSSTIIVPVEHMYAKVKLRVTLDRRIIAINEAEVSSVYFEKAPWYCRVGTLYDENPVTSQDEKYVYANGNSVAWTTRPLGTEEGGNNIDDPNNNAMPEDSVKYEYVIYIPENIQGEHAKAYESDTKLEIGETLAHASAMCVVLDYKAEDVGTYGEEQLSKTYKVYPGGNNEDNFNIRRNQVYRITMNLGYPIDPDNEPSANCIVIKPNTTASFEPYYRLESGGSYNFNDYISPNSEVGSGKQIKKIKILWQTENCIGDNSKGDLVYLRPSSGDLDNQSLHDKIYVTTNQPGNAVIAAYDKDPDDDDDAEIIWSWHIWVPNEGEDPTNVAKAITYYTYDWDETKIYGKDTDKARVPGYGCMPCNLGALASEPKATSGEDAVITYGMLYQWGRKDPFPALKGAASGKYGTGYKYTEYGAYNQNTTEHLWDNDYNRITGMTDDTDTDSLFHSVTAMEILSNSLDVDFSIKNPTVFMCGTEKAAQRSQAYVAGNNTDTSYVTGHVNYPETLGGDWHVNSDERLWGATEVTSSTKCLKIGTDRSGDVAHLYDDYGEKSIFDPCPYGWRVSPPDQWLGYTDDGGNPTSNNYTTKINYEKAYGYGMYMYIQNWREGLTSYFPTQGTRAPDGSGGRPIRCGNYHNATADAGVMQRVNILHIHNGGDFNIFELGILAYYVKSVAGPVRCVREIK